MANQLIKQELNRSLSLSIPLIITYLVIGSTNFFGVTMIGKLGKNGLAAAALVFAVYNIIMVFSYGFLSAINVLVAQQFGAYDIDGAGKAAAQGIISALILGISMFAILWWSAHILPFSDQSKTVLHYASQYLHAMALAILPLCLLMAIQKFLASINKTKFIMCISFIEAPLEILAAYALIFGKFGLPRLGIAGLGYAFLSVYILIDVFLLLLLALKQEFKNFHIYSHLKKIDKGQLKDLFTIGGNTGIMYIFEVTFLMLLAFMMGHLGTTALAAHQIARQFSAITMMIVVGISQAVTIHVGQGVGHNSYQQIKLGAAIAAILGISLMLLVGICYLLFAHFILSIDINTNSLQLIDLTKMATSLLIIVAFTQIVDALRCFMMGALRGLKDTKIPMFITGITLWLIGLPLAYLLAFKLHLGGIGLWWGFTLSIAICAAILTMRFRRLANDYRPPWGQTLTTDNNP